MSTLLIIMKFWFISLFSEVVHILDHLTIILTSTKESHPSSLAQLFQGIEGSEATLITTPAPLLRNLLTLAPEKVKSGSAISINSKIESFTLKAHRKHFKIPKLKMHPVQIISL